MRNDIIGLRNWSLSSLPLINFEEIVHHLIFSIGVDVTIENGQTVNVSDCIRDFAQRFDVFLVRNALLKD